MAAAIEIDVRQGMVAGNGREVVIDPAIGLLIVIPINPESASVIARKSGSVIGPVLSIETRTSPVRSLKTIAQGLGVYAIGTIVTAIAVGPGMNGVNRPSGPDPVSTKIVPSGQMQRRRLQRPSPQRTT